MTISKNIKHNSFVIFLIFSHRVLGQTKDSVGQYQSGFGGLLSFGLQSLGTGLGQNSNTFTTPDYS